jgi:hypothetical protein
MSVGLLEYFGGEEDEDEEQDRDEDDVQEIAEVRVGECERHKAGIRRR